MAKDNRMKNITVVTNDFTASNGEHYYIVSFDVDSKYLTGKRYGAINYDDVESNGKVKKTLNGYQMYMKETVAEVITEIEYRIKVERTAEAEGIGKMAAVLLINGDGKVSKEQCIEMAKRIESLRV